MNDYNKTIELNSTYLIADLARVFLKQKMKENEWINVLTTQSGDRWFIKSEYVSKDGAAIKIWIKVEKKSKTIIKNGKSLNYTNVKSLILAEFDYNSKQFKFCSAINYDSNGKVLQSSDDESDWENIIPESVIETVYNKVYEQFN